MSALSFAHFDAGDGEAESNSDYSESEPSAPKSRKKSKAPKSRAAKKVGKARKSDRGSRRGNGKIMKYTTWRSTPDTRPMIRSVCPRISVQEYPAPLFKLRSVISEIIWLLPSL